MNPRARRAHNPDPDPLDDPRHESPTDVEVDYFRDLGYVDNGLSRAGGGEGVLGKVVAVVSSPADDRRAA